MKKRLLVLIMVFVMAFSAIPTYANRIAHPEYNSETDRMELELEKLMLNNEYIVLNGKADKKVRLRTVQKWTQTKLGEKDEDGYAWYIMDVVIPPEHILIKVDSFFRPSIVVNYHDYAITENYRSSDIITYKIVSLKDALDHLDDIVKLVAKDVASNFKVDAPQYITCRVGEYPYREIKFLFVEPVFLLNYEMSEKSSKVFTQEIKESDEVPETKPLADIGEWYLCFEDGSVLCKPGQIYVIQDIGEEQSLKFVLNATSDVITYQIDLNNEVDSNGMTYAENILGLYAASISEEALELVQKGDYSLVNAALLELSDILATELLSWSDEYILETVEWSVKLDGKSKKDTKVETAVFQFITPEKSPENVKP